MTTAPHIKDLTNLCLKGVEHLPTQTLKDLLSVTSCLRSLDISGWSSWDDESGEDLLSCLPNLEVLQLCSLRLSDQMMQKVGRCLPCLRQLNISACSNLTDPFLSSIQSSFKALQNLCVIEKIIFDEVVEGWGPPMVRVGANHISPACLSRLSSRGVAVYSTIDEF
eukprot:TRINITY_DN2324_c0_g1_i1.p1 TRINITY_DN2324_c0_g1~~TRINITY_DN2324_c0_g1_i1.p1  ORF type:complete len:166 (+),score=35.41 TRINITY_DN2324_c0_g1_i1:233-730(+)